jgi:subtilisin family serine protease
MKTKQQIVRPVFYILPLIALISTLGFRQAPLDTQDNPATATPVVSDTAIPTAGEPTTDTPVTPTDLPTDTAQPTQTETPVPSDTPVPTLIPTEPTEEPPTATDVPGKMVRLLVGRESLPFMQSFAFALPWQRSCRLAAELAKIGVVVEEVPSGELDTTLDALSKDSNVEFVERIGEVSAQDLIPNDPGFAKQPELNQIHAPQGWDLSTGGSDVTIAIIDSGVDAGQPDLGKKVMGGCDFVHEDADASDDNGHGTHVAGIAAAIGGDGVGIAGVSWGAQILPVKVLDNNGDGDYASVAAGIIWAADHGAEIINLSLGGAKGNRTLKAAVDYATNKGSMVIAASGNDGYSSLRYPAGYESVLSVGSVDAVNNRSDFSDYGASLDLVAPGENIYSTVPGGYDWKSGTSMSAPYVSGLAAVLWSIPGNNNAARVQAEIVQSAQDLGKVGWDSQYGYGLIRMDMALKGVLQPATATSNATTVPSAVYSTPTLGRVVNMVMTATPAPVTASAVPPVAPTFKPQSTQQSQEKLKGVVAQDYDITGTVPDVDANEPTGGSPWLLFIGIGLIAAAAICFGWLRIKHHG